MGTKVEEAWKKGSAELLILSLLEDQPRHGYESASSSKGARVARSIFMWPRSTRCYTGWKNEIGSRGGGWRNRIKGDAGITG